MRAVPVLIVAASLCAAGAAGAQSNPGQSQSLEARVTALEAPRVNVTVHCASGESIGAVLAQYAGWSNALAIRLVGTCVETVAIFRNNVIVFADSPGDGVQAPPGAFQAFLVFGNSTVLSGLTIHADNNAIDVRRGGVLSARNLTITAGNAGIDVRNATLELLNSTIEKTLPTMSPSAAGVHMSGATAEINATTVRNFTAANGGRCGICAFDGSSAMVRNSTIEGNATGIFIQSSSVTVGATQVRNNGNGFDVHNGGSLTMFGGAISGNTGNGVLAIGSSVSLGGAMVIENNTGPGVRARVNTVVRLEAITIRGNGGGMQLSDGSVVSSDQSPSVLITGNQRGVVCLGTPGVTHAGYISAFGTLSLDATNVFGNGPLGPNISCPGIFVP